MNTIDKSVKKLTSPRTERKYDRPSHKLNCLGRCIEENNWLFHQCARGVTRLRITSIKARAAVACQFSGRFMERPMDISGNLYRRRHRSLIARIRNPDGASIILISFARVYHYSVITLPSQFPLLIL